MKNFGCYPGNSQFMTPILNFNENVPHTQMVHVECNNALIHMSQEMRPTQHIVTLNVTPVNTSTQMVHVYQPVILH